MSLRAGLLISYTIITFFGVINSDFLVNVKTQAGNIVKQSIRENTADSSITLEYKDWDLTKITQLVDFKSSLNIFRIIIYGEVELSQPTVQILCFVNHLTVTGFIEPDAVSKLRQKNQDAIRTSENQLGEIFTTADLSVSIATSHLLSDHINDLCAGSNGAIYTTEDDIRNAAKDSGRDYETMMSSTKRLTAIALSRCGTTSTMTSDQCSCRYHFAIDWYPCSLKYCKGMIGDKPTTYKCGIKTCGVTRVYEFPVANKAACWWEHLTS